MSDLTCSYQGGGQFFFSFVRRNDRAETRGDKAALMICRCVTYSRDCVTSPKRLKPGSHLRHNDITTLT